jgi:hypothetical protein
VKGVVGYCGKIFDGAGTVVTELPSSSTDVLEVFVIFD